MIALLGVTARATIQRVRVVLTDVSLEHAKGVLGILGAPADGTSLLLDVLDGTTKPKAGRASVRGGSPEASRARIARVSIEAPLPEALRVDEACDLEAALRGGSPQPASERLGTLGIAMLASRPVRSLSREERRAVALAIALTSTATVLLVEEPLVTIDPIASRFVVDALRARAATSTVIVTTASPRDAMRVADHLGVLTQGAYSPLSRELGQVNFGAASQSASMRIVVAASAGKRGAAAIAGDLSAADVVTHVEVSPYAASSGAVAIFVSGSNLEQLARVVTHAIATARVDVDLVETNTLSLDELRASVAARQASAPAGGDV